MLKSCKNSMLILELAIEKYFDVDKVAWNEATSSSGIFFQSN